MTAEEKEKERLKCRQLTSLEKSPNRQKGKSSKETSNVMGTEGFPRVTSSKEPTCQCRRC